MNSIEKAKTVKKRNAIDKTTKVAVYLISSLGMLIFLAILIYVFSTGKSLLSWELITSDYNAINTDITVVDGKGDYSLSQPRPSDEYYSNNWGIAIKDETDIERLVIFVGDRRVWKKEKRKEKNEKERKNDV